MLIPGTSLGDTSASLSLNNSTNVSANVSASSTPMTIDINSLDLGALNNQLLMKDVLKNTVTQNTTTPKLNTSTATDTGHNNAAKLTNDILMSSFDIHSTPTSATGNKNDKKINTPTPATKLNGKNFFFFNIFI